MLTKQLQVLIETSLAQGKQYEDIKNILSIQGFEEAAIEQLFVEYQSQAGSPAATPVAQAAPPTPPPDPAKEQQPPQPEKIDDVEIIGDDFMPEEPVSPAEQPTQAPPEVQQEQGSSLASSTMGSEFMAGAATAPMSQQSPTPPQTLDTPFSVPTPATKTSTPPVTPTPPPTPQPVAQTSPVTPPAPIAPPQPQNPIVVGIGGPEIAQIQAQAEAEQAHKSIVPLLIILIVILAAISGFLFWYYVLSDFGKTSEAERAMLGLDEEASVEDAVDPARRDPFTGEVIE